MSTRILPVPNFDFRMSELRRRLQPPSVEPPTTQPEAPRQQQRGVTPSRAVRRNLFGKIDHDENNKFVQAELTKIAAADAKRWNFDFRKEEPLEGRFKWRLAQAGEVPNAYEMPGLSVRLNPSSSTAAAARASTSQDVEGFVSASKETAPPSAENNTPPHTLEETLAAVTTAVTTVLCHRITQTLSSHQKEERSKAITTAQRREKSPENTKSVKKQSNITDYLKVCKRPHPSTSLEQQKLDSDDVPPPALKRARTS